MTALDNTTPAGPSFPGARPGSRAQRARMPIAVDVVEAAATSHGVCIRPVPMKVTDTRTGEVSFVDVPCGATLASKCPSCAERARRLRMHQCREGWHLDTDPVLQADDPNTEQVGLAIERADLTEARDDARDLGDDADWQALVAALMDKDAEIRQAGVRGEVEPGSRPRPKRSTRRRQDAPDLPKRAMENTTVGRAFIDTKTGRVFRPSLFLTVTLDSYGRVRSDGTPVNPGEYDYQRAARDALAFSRLLDRLMQNLRRVAGYDVQYFATVEPQRRLAPHAHFAVRGTIPRTLLRQVIAATYHQVWWPSTGKPMFDRDRAPVWASHAHGTDWHGFIDPDTGVALTPWVDAMAELDQPWAEPRHVIRFGPQIDVQGLLAGTADADRRIGYLAKYLTKSMTEAHADVDVETDAVRAHVDRLHAALQEEPCSPRCANWLRYGIEPQGAHPEMLPGSCRSKAHKREHLGYAGRRILVSRKWSGKTLADHKHDRRAWVLATLGVDPSPATDGTSDKTREHFTWEPADRDDPVAPLPTRLLHAVAQRQRWRAAYERARDGEPPPALGDPFGNSPPDDPTASAA